jgi:hypothetical protein
LGRRTWWVALALATAASALAQGGATAARGEQMYDGRLPLAGTVRGHAQAMPAQASRCTNCHEPSRQPNQNDAAFAPRLDRTSLATAIARRGGPASSYDEASFCRLLREGVDPAQILVNRTMPQYALSNEDCAALWQYLSSRPGTPAAAPR